MYNHLYGAKTIGDAREHTNNRALIVHIQYKRKQTKKIGER